MSLVDRQQKRAEIRAMFKSNVKRRLMVDKAVMGTVVACAVVAIVPLLWILGTAVYYGIPALNWEFLTAAPGAVGAGQISIGPAIQGTLIIIGLTSVIGLPIGVMGGIYLAEFGGNSMLARVVRFYMDVFMHMPSIVLGIFAFLAIVLFLGYYTVWAGAIALSMIMFPIVARSTEESLRMVPWTYREAGAALGLSKMVITLRIVLSQAKKGILTGILLSISRVGGETAPLIMTILGSNIFFEGFASSMDALPLRIWRLSLQPYDEARVAGWGAALTLIIIIFAIHVGVRYFFLRDKSGKGLSGALRLRRGVG